MEYLSSSRRVKHNEEQRVLPEFTSEGDEMRSEWVDNKDKERKSEETILQDPKTEEHQQDHLRGGK